MRNVSYKSCRENLNRHFIVSDVCFFGNRAVYENVENFGAARGATNDVTTWRIGVARVCESQSSFHTVNLTNQYNRRFYDLQT